MKVLRFVAACAATGALAASKKSSAEEDFPKASKAKPSTGADAGHGATPLLTVEGAKNIAMDSVFLTKDLVQHLVKNLHDLVWGHLPPNVQKQVNEQLDTVKQTVETQRLKYGVPSFSNMITEAKSEYAKKAAPIFGQVWDQFSNVLAKPAEVVKMGIAHFEKEYPEHAGKLGVEIFDTALILALLMYFVANPFKKLFGQVVCCGMCASRKPTKAPVTVKSVDRKGKTNGTKK